MGQSNYSIDLAVGYLITNSSNYYEPMTKIRIEQSNFTDTQSIAGGAVFIDQSVTVNPIIISQCNFTNFTGEVGSVIHTIGVSSIVNICNDSEFINNSALVGGAIYASNGDQLDLDHVVFKHHTALAGMSA